MTVPNADVPIGICLGSPSCPGTQEEDGAALVPLHKPRDDGANFIQIRQPGSVGKGGEGLDELQGIDVQVMGDFPEGGEEDRVPLEQSCEGVAVDLVSFGKIAQSLVPEFEEPFFEFLSIE